MFIVAREFRLKVALLLLVIFCFFGCGAEVEFVVEILDLPNDAVQVEIQPWHRGGSLHQLAPRVGIVSGRASLSVLLRLNDTAQGVRSAEEPFMVAVAALDSRNCISAIGSAARSWASLDGSTLPVSMIPSREEFSHCPSVPQPVLRDKAKPIDISLDEASIIELAGWGFSERIQMRANGKLQAINIKSPLSLTIDTSNLSWLPGAIQLELTDPIAAQPVVYEDFLRIVPNEVSRHTSIYPVRTSDKGFLIGATAAKLSSITKPVILRMETDGSVVKLRRLLLDHKKMDSFGIELEEIGNAVLVPDLRVGVQAKLLVADIQPSGSLGVILQDKTIWICTGIETQPICSKYMTETETINDAALYTEGNIAYILLAFDKTVERRSINWNTGKLESLTSPFKELSQVCAIATHHLNQDGMVDLVAVGGGSLFTALTNDQGDFEVKEYQFERGFSCNNTAHIAIGDIDGNALPDIWINRSRGIFFNEKSQQGIVFKFQNTNKDIASTFANCVIDLNSDTLGDLVWNTNGKLSVSRSLGRTFTDISYVELGSVQPIIFQVVDLDGKGQQALVLGEHVVLVH